jgi:hypothetical protein
MMTITTDLRDQGNYPLLRTVLTALTQYVWIIPVVFGVPGNILAMLVANRKHNRNLAPCLYMAAMAAVDTLFLLETLWFYTLFTPGRLYGLTTLYQRGRLAMSVLGFLRFGAFIISMSLYFEKKKLSQDRYTAPVPLYIQVAVPLNWIHLQCIKF